MNTLKIELIHDVVCSWCHIGYHNISKALDRLSGLVSAEFHYLPYQLNPDLGPRGVPIIEHLCQRNRWSFAEAMAYRENLLAITKELGVTIDFGKRTHYYNTSRAHRLITAAERVGLQREMHRALLLAYHVHGENIGDADVLEKIARGVGFNAGWVGEILDSAAITRHMEKLSARVGQFPVASVPAFIFNGSKFVGGSNSVAFFEQFIRSEFLQEAQCPAPGVSQTEEAIPCPM